MPGRHDLRGRLAVLLREPGDRRLREQFTAPGERAPGLGRDRVLPEVGTQFTLGEPGVKLDLVQRGQCVGLRREAFEVGDPEVGDADRACLAVRGDLLEGPPGKRGAEGAAARVARWETDARFRARRRLTRPARSLLA
jgi:hypothetical protein